MAWAVVIVRVLVGAGFIVFGMSHFIDFMPKPEGLPDNAVKFMGVLMPTHYMDVVKVLEVVGGFLVLIGLTAPLGLVILVPVTVNIALWDALIVKYAMPPVGTILLALEVFLIWGYRKNFAGVLSVNARPT